MWLRILIGGIVGGVLVFCMGAVNHTVLHLQDRTFLKIPDSSTFSEHLASRGLAHGLYVFPDMPTAADQSDPAKMEAFNERYGAGLRLEADATPEEIATALAAALADPSRPTEVERDGAARAAGRIAELIH